MHIWMNVLLTVSPRVVTIMYMKYTYLCVYIPDTVRYFRAASPLQVNSFFACFGFLWPDLIQTVIRLEPDSDSWSQPFVAGLQQENKKKRTGVICFCLRYCSGKSMASMALVSCCFDFPYVCKC